MRRFQSGGFFMAKKCAGLKGKGRLKKGFKWKKGHSCPVPAKKGKR